MNIIEYLLLVLITGTLIIISVIVGANLGQKIERGVDIELPKMPNPVKIISSVREERRAQAEREKLETVLANIDTYDGTEYGQKDIPR